MASAEEHELVQSHLSQRNHRKATRLCLSFSSFVAIAEKTLAASDFSDIAISNSSGSNQQWQPKEVFVEDRSQTI
jgi:hypothetical protein